MYMFTMPYRYVAHYTHTLYMQCVTYTLRVGTIKGFTMRLCVLRIQKIWTNIYKEVVHVHVPYH